MASIPLYTGGAQFALGQVNPITPGLQSLSINAARQGAQLGAEVPSIASAISQGVTQGIGAFQTVRANEANIAKAEAQAAVAPELAQAQILQAQTAAVKAATEARLAPSLADAQLAKAKADGAEANLKVQEAKDLEEIRAQRADTKSQVQSAFKIVNDSTNPEIIDKTLQGLESNLGSVVSSSLIRENGAVVGFDPVISARISQLPEAIARTGNPELAQRAQQFLGRYQEAINQQISTKKGEQISLAGAQTGGDRDQRPPTTPQEVIEREIGQRGSQTPQEPQIPSAAFKEAPTAAEGQQPTPRTEAELFEAQTGRSVADVLLARGVPTTQERVEIEKAKLLEKTPSLKNDPFKLQTEARKMAELSKASAAVEEESLTLINSASLTNELAVKAEKIEKDLFKLSQKAPELLDTFGKSALAPSFYAKAEAYIKRDPEARILLDDVREELKGLAGSKKFQVMMETSATAKMFDSNREGASLEALSGLGENNSFRSIIDGITVLKNKAELAKNTKTVYQAARSAGLGDKDAFELSTRYKSMQPLLEVVEVAPGVSGIQGGEFTSPSEFLMEQLDIRVPGMGSARTADGRAIATPAIDSFDIAQEFTTKATGENAPLSLSAAEDLADNLGTLRQEIENTSGLDIPRKQPNGASRETILMLIGTENAKLDPSAKAVVDAQSGIKSSATGLMQILDRTGKELWKQLELPGAYDPTNPGKNIAMGTEYLNQQLVRFDGDTELALAAYNAGPERVQEAVLLALKNKGKGDWKTAKLYMPEKTEADRFAKQQVVPYVNKIMNGRPEKAKGSPQHREAVVSTLEAPRARENAKKNLTGEGIDALEQVSQVNTVEEARGTILADALDMLMSPMVSEAQAQEPTSRGDEQLSLTSQEEESSFFQDFGDATATAVQPVLDVVRAGLKQSDLFAPVGAVMELAKEEPEKVQAMAIGGARELLWGGDDELATWWRESNLGEDPETARNNVKKIKQYYEEKYPEFYTAGQSAAIAGQMALGGMAVRGAKSSAQAVGRGINKLRGVAPAAVEEFAPRVAKEVGRQGLIQSAKTGAKGGAIGGGVTGFLDAEGGFEERAKGATFGAGVGAGAGAVFGAGISAAESAFAGRAARKASKQFPKIELNEAETQLMDIFENVPVEKLDDAIAAAGASGDDVGALITKLPDANLNALVDRVAKDPKVSPGVRSFAKEVITEQEERLARQIDTIAGKEIVTEEALDDFAETVLEKTDEIWEARKVAAVPAYQAARDSLPKLKTKQPTRTASSLLVDQYGNPIPLIDETSKVVEEVPGYTSKAVKEALKDPRVKEGIAAARKDFPELANHPDASLEILQATKSTMYDIANTLKQADKKSKKAGRINISLKKLTKAMHENPTVEAADKLYEEGSDEIDAMGRRAVKEIL